ncbi:MAG: hypothetical protein HY904_09330 [Deltaproteobacteria bacterium]|nr:hypothetical protein [Deltaproteobacteria bacterium]
MNSELRAMLTGGGLVLAVVGGLFGLWSMKMAPDPPAMSSARKEEGQVRDAITAQMREFMTHYRRANDALARRDTERTLANLLVIADFSEELQHSRVEHKVPADNVVALRTSADAAAAAVRAGAPDAVDRVRGLAQSCNDCHARQNGPPPEKLFGAELTAVRGEPLPVQAPAAPASP